MRAYATTARQWVDDRRPDTGAMGVLYQQRPSLYWLVIAVGVLAYAGLVSFLTLMVGLLALAGAQALLAASGGAYVAGFAWFGLSALSFGALLGATYVAARWASQYEVSE